MLHSQLDNLENMYRNSGNIDLLLKDKFSKLNSVDIKPLLNKFVNYDINNYKLLDDILLDVCSEISEYINILKNRKYQLPIDTFDEINDFYVRGITGLYNQNINNMIPISELVNAHKIFDMILKRISNLNFKESLIDRCLLGSTKEKLIKKLNIIIEQEIFYYFDEN